MEQTLANSNLSHRGPRANKGISENEKLPFVRNEDIAPISVLKFSIFGYRLAIDKPFKSALDIHYKTNWRARAYIILSLFGISLIANILLAFFSTTELKSAALKVEPAFYLYVSVGFGAQFIGSFLGMGYGITSQLFLMSLGIPQATASSSIHTAEMFSSGVSGFSHYKFGNVNKKLFRVMLLPGVIGAIVGALFLVFFGEKYAGWIKPVLAVYGIYMGIKILSSAFVKRNALKQKVKNVGWLALTGGFLDSFGGGGWGPLVTSTLISKGRAPNYVIGTDNLTKFFVTFASAVTFFTTIGVSHWHIIVGLIIGGVVAAPIAARLAGKLPTKWMFVGVGIMIIIWSLKVLSKVVL